MGAYGAQPHSRGGQEHSAGALPVSAGAISWALSLVPAGLLGRLIPNWARRSTSRLPGGICAGQRGPIGAGNRD